WQSVCSSLCLLVEGLRLLLHASSSEHVHHRIIPLVTSVFKQRSRGSRKRHFPSPGFRESRRIVHSELIENGIRTGAFEALHEMQILVGSPKVSLVCEVGGMIVERVALPMA